MNPSPRRTFIALLAALALGLSALPALAQAEQIELSVSPSANVETDELTVDGSNFARPNGSHPGVYLVFGVKTKFPSQGFPWGKYIPSMENQRYIAWPGTPTEGSANEVFTVEEGLGEFEGLDLKVRTQFVAQDMSFVNCKAVGVECGVIAIGAHGQAHANAEDFFPIQFASGFETE